MSMIFSSVAVSSDFTKCVEVQQYYKKQLTACEQARVGLEHDKKYLVKEVKDGKDYLLPFGLFGITTDHFQGCVVGVVVGMLI